MIKNRFFKTTLGRFAELAITTQYENIANIKLFVDTAAAGSINAFWADTNLALAPGDTALAANVDRQFYYAWKQGIGTEYHKSTQIPVRTRKYDSVVYNAGTAQVSTLTCGGTYSLGQRVWVRIINTTSQDLPYPSFDYSAVIGAGGINQAMVDIAASLNAENLRNSPIVTATSATNTLVVTAKDKYTAFQVLSYVEVTAVQPTDGSAATVVTSVQQKAPIGDPASVAELQQYFIVNNGGINYAPDGANLLEFGTPTTNVGTNAVTQFGFLLVTSVKREPGEVKNFANYKANIIIAVKTVDVATLAAL